MFLELNDLGITRGPSVQIGSRYGQSKGRRIGVGRKARRAARRAKRVETRRRMQEGKIVAQKAKEAQEYLTKLKALGMGKLDPAQTAVRNRYLYMLRKVSPVDYNTYMDIMRLRPKPIPKPTTVVSVPVAPIIVIQQKPGVLPTSPTPLQYTAEYVPTPTRPPVTTIPAVPSSLPALIHPAYRPPKQIVPPPVMVQPTAIPIAPAIPAIPAAYPAPQPLPYGPQYATTYQQMSSRVPTPIRQVAQAYPVYPQQRGYEMVPSVQQVVRQRVETPVYEDITSSMLFGEPVIKAPLTYEELYARPEPEPMVQERYYEPMYYEQDYYEQAFPMSMPVTMEQAGRFSPYDEQSLYGIDKDVSNQNVLLLIGALGIGLSLLSSARKKGR